MDEATDEPIENTDSIISGEAVKDDDPKDFVRVAALSAAARRNGN